MAGLSFSGVELTVDEAQYWSWAQTPAWGYYSKPPLIAWLIGVAQGVCGQEEACVRAPATLAWAVTALAVAGVGTALFDRRTGLWAGLAALLAPGAAYSARIMSTDAPLLAFWALALLAFVRLRAGAGARWGILLAVAFGLGLLTKYAMAYFAGCLLIAALVDPETLRALRRPAVWGGLAAGVLFLVPNLAWQLGHGLATVQHTIDNATGGGATPGLEDGLEFMAAQFILAGPVVLAFAIAALWAPRPNGTRLLLALSLPVLTGLTLLAFITRAHANWAATALVAVFVLGTAEALRQGRTHWLAGGLAFGLLVQIALPLADAAADRLVLGRRPVYATALGWQDFAAQVRRYAEHERAAVVVTAKRRETAALLYYGGDRKIAVWPATGRPENHFQLDRPLTPALAGRAAVLAVVDCETRFPGWARVTDLGEIASPTGPGRQRLHRLYRLEQPTAPIRPPEPCA